MENPNQATKKYLGKWAPSQDFDSSIRKEYSEQPGEFGLDEIPTDEDPEDALDPKTKPPNDTDTPSQK
jgi:hypothetical protein